MSDSSSSWVRTWKADPLVAALANRHYSRQRRGSKQFAPPGRVLILRTADGAAAWITYWPMFSRHGQGDAWICSFFRNEAPERYRSSALVVEAVAATRASFGGWPAGGFITFVDERRVRRKRDPGRCFRRAGFVPVGRSVERNYLILHLAEAAAPAPVPAVDWQGALAL